MKRNCLCLMCVAALASPAVLAQAVGGSVSVTGIHSNVNGDNPFRFFEYRDLDSGVTGGVDLRGGTESYWWGLFGENLGRDDQYAIFRGGRYGLFKYALYNDDVIHNLTFNARTLYNGVGANNLTFTGPPSTDVSTWNSFDYSIKHRNYGGLFDLQSLNQSPFYLRVDANRKETKGVRPISGAGASPGGPVYELPVPVDYTTTNFSAETGYASRTAQFSINAAYSKFEDQNDFVNWRNPIVATGSNLERSTLAADNTLWRVGVNAMWRQLPMSSTLALRGTWSKLESRIPIDTTFLSVTGTAGSVRLANPSESTFDGEVINKSLSASLTSQLARGLDSRLYWNWNERENKSTELVFTPGGPGTGGGCDLSSTGAALATCTPEHFGYKKHTVGLEVGYRVAPANKVTGTVEYLEIERERIDFDKNREMKLQLEWKSGTFEMFDTRVKYQHLRRRSDFLLSDSTNIFDKYLFRFDAAPLDRDVLKLVMDSNPVEFFDIGGEINLKRNKYKDTVLGRTKDTRREFYVSASYGNPEALRVTAFFDVEYTKYESTHWVGATTTFPNPNTAGTTYLWDADVKDKNYLVGVAANWPFKQRVKLQASVIWQKTDGTVDFATPNGLGNPVNIGAYDSFKKRSLNVKGTFAATRQLDVTLGYAYEKFDYRDVQMDDYLYTVRTGTTQNFLTGAYAFPSYNANVVYMTVAYKFQ